MKIAVFNVGKSDRILLEKWLDQNPGHEFKIYSEGLSMENIHLAEGMDSVSISANVGFDKNVYYKLKEMNIKLISQRSAGVDMHDIDLIKELGLTLINVPVYSPNAIAEYVLYSAMYFTRKMNIIMRNVNEQDFRWQGSILARELRTLTVGIIGTGHIGKQAAKLFSSLGAKVIGYGRSQDEEAKQYLEYVELDDLYEKSDIISFHIPLNKENYHMIDSNTFEKMKDGVIIINSARGGIIDTEALINAIKSGKVSGVALDVYEFENNFTKLDLRNKEINDEIFKRMLEDERIMFTPHIAFYTETAVERILIIPIEESVKFFETGNSNNIVK